MCRRFFKGINIDRFKYLYNYVNIKKILIFNMYMFEIFVFIMLLLKIYII